MSLYRRNKFGESIEVERYECGSCANYEFEREDKDNYCKHYGKYYPYRDSCRGYWTEFSESSGGCFLTTACCEYKGLPDDCRELEILREFRDNILCKSVSGSALKQHYYEVAPGILDKLEKRSNKDEILDWIYCEVQKIVSLVEKGEDDEAISRYVLMVLKTEEKVSD